MAATCIDINAFLELSKSIPVLDVRSPGEYNHAHIPGAYSLPLFTDEERKIVGTAYKQEGREEAIKIGLDFFGPKMRSMVTYAEEVIRNSEPGIRKAPFTNTQLQIPNPKSLIVHCWRGGMRSAAVAWLLDVYGFNVYTLVGGYKVFRQHVLNTFSQPFHFRILGGYTGSGKTYLLKALKKRGEVVIDLEGLANHKGSAFGAIGMPAQPSQEMFENLLAERLRAAGGELRERNFHNSPFRGLGGIWLEDESQRLGLVNIPQSLWSNMRNASIFFLEIPFEERLKHITEEYGKLDKEKMANAIIRIKKRLGGLEMKTAINYLQEDNFKDCFDVLLRYYDKQYTRGLLNRKNLETLLNKFSFDTVDENNNAKQLIASLQIEKFA